MTINSRITRKPLVKKLALAVLSGLMLTAVSSCSVSAHSDKKPSTFEYDTSENNGSSPAVNPSDPRSLTAKTRASADRISGNAWKYPNDRIFMVDYEKAARMENAAQTTVSLKTLHSINDADNELLRSIEKGTLKKLVIAYNLDSSEAHHSPFQRICGVTERTDFAIEFAPEVTSLYGLFEGCTLKSLPKALNTSRIVSMERMFAGARIEAPLPQMDTSRVRVMTEMFAKSVIETPLPGFAVSEFAYMGRMFQGSVINRKIKVVSENLDLTHFFSDAVINVSPDLDIRKAENLTGMFAGAVINAPLNIDAPAAARLDKMFRKADLRREVSFTPKTRPSSVISMFEEASFASGVSAPDLDTSEVTDMKCMFKSTRNLRTVPAYNTARVRDFSEMFRGSSVSEVPVLDIAEAQSMAGMFAGAANLRELPELDMTKIYCPVPAITPHQDSSAAASAADIRKNCRLYLTRVPEKPAPRESGSNAVADAFAGVLCIITLPICASVMSTAVHQLLISTAHH